MKYISTRGGDVAENFEEVVMKGLAADGGLFVPETYPKFSVEKIASFKDLSYAELAFEVINPYVDGAIEEGELKSILNETYKNFRDDAIAPIVKLSDDEYILELFHGPTLAFKDFALQLLGRLFDKFLEGTGKKINIIGATSGDTGSAAISGCAGRDSINIFILHPEGRVSDVQRKQMTTVLTDNVFNLAVKGSFDDCQNIVKELFGDLELKDEYNLTAVNSINWGRIVAQIVYYFYAAAKFDGPVSFSVPTGNFGDILAGWIAHKMGLKINKLVIATNKNDILHRFMQTGTYKKAGVSATLSPSMDIEISSNFERLLFEYHGRDSEQISAKIAQLKSDGEFSVDENILNEIKELFASGNCDDGQTVETIKSTNEYYDYLADPHTATGIFAGRTSRVESPIVTLATAHPAKFEEAIVKAVGHKAELPEHYSDLFDKEERFEVLDNAADAVRDYIAANN